MIEGKPNHNFYPFLTKSAFNYDSRVLLHDLHYKEIIEPLDIKDKLKFGDKKKSIKMWFRKTTRTIFVNYADLLTISIPFHTSHHGLVAVVYHFFIPGA